jgi:hypothetical protein
MPWSSESKDTKGGTEEARGNVRASHHNYTTRKPRPATAFSQKTQQKPQKQPQKNRIKAKNGIK